MAVQVTDQQRVQEFKPLSMPYPGPWSGELFHREVLSNHYQTVQAASARTGSSASATVHSSCSLPASMVTVDELKVVRPAARLGSRMGPARARRTLLDHGLLPPTGNVTHGSSAALYTLTTTSHNKQQRLVNQISLNSVAQSQIRLFCVAFAPAIISDGCFDGNPLPRMGLDSGADK